MYMKTHSGCRSTDSGTRSNHHYSGVVMPIAISGILFASDEDAYLDQISVYFALGPYSAVWFGRSGLRIC